MHIGQSERGAFWFLVRRYLRPSCSNRPLIAFPFALIIVVTSLLQPRAAFAGTESDQLREELRQLKQDYEQRLRKIEEQLERLDAQSATSNKLTATPSTNVTVVAGPTNAAAVAQQFANEQFA